MNLNELEKLYAAGTPGPWNGYDDRKSTGRQEVVAVGVTVARCYAGNDNALNDGHLIVAMHTMLPKLIAVAQAAVKFRHYPQCRLSWSLADHDSACTCGVTNLREALAALNDLKDPIDQAKPVGESK